jgi:hypothetical protein
MAEMENESRECFMLPTNSSLRAFGLQFSTKRAVIAVLFVCIVGAAIVRGNYLLGTAVATVFGLLACGALFLVYRVFTTTGEFRFVRQVIVLVFAVGVLTVLTIPAWFNPDLGVLIEGHQTERTTRSQLRKVFSGDPRFANLDFHCDYTKCIVVSVHGSIETELDFLDLRKGIFMNCPKVSSRWLHWKVTVEESDNTHDANDSSLFGAPVDALGRHSR